MYDPNLMPTNIDEWNQLITAKVQEEAAKAAADESYMPQTREQIEQTFACYYPREQPVFEEPELTPEQKLAQARRDIDVETSAAILAGFDYEVNGQTLHFSYDAFDQQNFADTANACLMAKSGAQGLPDAVTWNAYDSGNNLVRLTLTADEFLALYAAGALAHKAACMEAGGAKKAALGA